MNRFNQYKDRKQVEEDDEKFAKNIAYALSVGLFTWFCSDWLYRNYDIRPMWLNYVIAFVIGVVLLIVMRAIIHRILKLRDLLP